MHLSSMDTRQSPKKEISLDHFLPMNPNKHICTFCGKEIGGDPDYTEDGEMVHSECLEEYNKFWKDRSEFIDLIGF